MLAPSLQRAAAWTPLQLPSVEAAYDFSNPKTLYTDTGLTTNVSADADAVAGIRDLSGNGRHATQSDSDYRGVYKVNIVNGRPVLRLENTDEGDYDMAGAEITGTAATILAVCGNRTGNGYRQVVTLEHVVMYASIAGSNQWGTFNNGDIVSGQEIPASGFISMMQVSRAGNDTDFYTDGGTVVHSSSGTYNDRYTWLFGGNLGIQLPSMDIAYLLVSTATLTTGQLNLAGNYFKRRYATTWTTI